MAQAKYADSAMSGNNGVFGGGDELILEEFFPELLEEELRLNGGVYGAKTGYLEMDEFPAEAAFDYGGSAVYEEPKVPFVLVPDNLEMAKEIAKQSIVPVYLAGHRGSAICDPYDLI